VNTTDFDRRLNDWFDSVDPKQVPPRIVFQALSQVADTGQIRGPLQRFAATIELAWRPRPALTSGIALVIITGLLIVALAAGVASGLIRLPSPPHVIDGLIAAEDALDNPDTSAAGDQQIRFIDPKTGNDVGGTDHDASACAAHFSPDGSRYVLLYQDPDQIGTGVVNIGVANADPQDFQPSSLANLLQDSRGGAPNRLVWPSVSSALCGHRSDPGWQVFRGPPSRLPTQGHVGRPD
jgi:hypothetical protein